MTKCNPYHLWNPLTTHGFTEFLKQRKTRALQLFNITQTTERKIQINTKEACYTNKTLTNRLFSNQNNIPTAL